jgi:ABC-type nitrate/sulfonate/bicarbonate transport system permease component
MRGLFRSEKAYGWISILALLVVWQILGTRLNPIFLSTPIRVARAAPTVVSQGHLLSNAWLTFWTFSVGLLAGMVIGVVVGIPVGRYRILRGFLDVLVRLWYSIPVIALFPLFILWFGTGIPFRLSVIFLAAVLPAVISTEAGVQSIDPSLLEVGKVFGATETELFRKFILPGTVPFIATGFKIAIGRTIVTTVAVELLTSNDGLGGLMSYYGNQLQTANYFVPLVVVAVLALVVYWIGDRVERRFSSWQEATP